MVRNLCRRHVSAALGQRNEGRRRSFVPDPAFRGRDPFVHGVAGQLVDEASGGRLGDVHKSGEFGVGQRAAHG